MMNVDCSALNNPLTRFWLSGHEHLNVTLSTGKEVEIFKVDRHYDCKEQLLEEEKKEITFIEDLIWS